MKNNIWVYALTLLLATAGRLFAADVDIDGATPGKWTMDLDAAAKVAAEKHLPILLDFSGSDWCGGCKLMEDNVFTKADWAAYASNSLMLVLIDFPENPDLVPKKYTARNQALSEQYNIEGFPTFVVLDDDGTTKLGEIKGATPGITPTGFMVQLKPLLRNRAELLARFVDSLDAEQQATYQALKDKLEKTKQLIDKQMKMADADGAKLKALRQAVTEIEQRIQQFRWKQELGADGFKVYQELKNNYDSAVKKLEDWISTNPESNEKNKQLYQDMLSKIQVLEKKLATY